MAGGPSENSIRDAAARKLESLGCWVVKTTRLTPGRHGIPDLLVCDPGSGGRLLALEFKKPTDPAPLTPSQRRELTALAKAGAAAAVVNSVQQVLDVLRATREERWPLGWQDLT